jgi:hypothetical protein
VRRVVLPDSAQKEYIPVEFAVENAPLQNFVHVRERTVNAGVWIVGRIKVRAL